MVEVPIAPVLQEGLRDSLRSLPPSRMRRKTLLDNTIIDPDFTFCMRLSLEEVIRFVEWWYVAIALLFEQLQSDEQVRQESEDIFLNNPRLVPRLDQEDNYCEIEIVIEHEGQNSFLPLGRATIVRRTNTLYEMCVTSVSWVQDMIRLLSGDLTVADEILREGEYGEIGIGRGRIIYTED